MARKKQNEEPLSVSEATKRAKKGADELEGAINKVDKTPGKHAPKRHADLESKVMSLLARKRGVVPDKGTTQE